MPFFGVSAMPIIIATETSGCKQVWIADDATGIGDVDDLKMRWDKISTFGPSFGYYPNATKTKVLVKPEFEEKAREIFKKSNVEVLTERHQVLGSVVESQKFVEQHVTGLVEEWLAELQTLSDIAKTEPQAALSGLTHGLHSKYTFLHHRVSSANSHIHRWYLIAQHFWPSYIWRIDESSEVTLYRSRPGYYWSNSSEFSQKVPLHQWTSNRICCFRKLWTHGKYFQPTAKKKKSSVQEQSSRIKATLDQSSWRMLRWSQKNGTASKWTRGFCMVNDVTDWIWRIITN